VPQPDFFIDIDGVLCDGPNLIKGGPESLSFLRSQSSRYLLVTNTTRMSASDIQYKLNGIGYKISSEEIFPVSQATVEYVNSRYSHAHCFLIGDENLDSLFQSHGHTVTRSDEPVDLVIIGHVEWAHFGEIDIARRLVEAGAEPVAMHKDPTWPDGGITRIGLGPIVAALQSAIARKITLIGKPETTFFETALARAGYPRSNTIMIGDSPQTDIAGAAGAGLRTLQVRTGNGVSSSLNGCDWLLDSIADLPQWYRSNFNR
tara:strand:+ start:2743 stop:3522 length:780 start_codon:yes stop_codon:yes gene_type:complete